MSDISEEMDIFLQHEIDPAFARRAKIIFENLDLCGNEKVLEIGCGRGFYLNVLSKVFPKLDIIGIDLNEKYLSIAKNFIKDKKVKLVKADAASLPFKDKTFDRIIATEILEHIPDDKKAISEMYRVLKPGGTAIITVPNKNYPFCWDPANWILEKVFNWHLPSNIWWLSGIWADHVRLYDEREIRELLGKEGFKIEKIWYSTHFCLPLSHFLFYSIGKNLVEKGFFSNMNRFSRTKRDSLLKEIILWPIRKVDNLNENKKNFSSSMNLVIKVIK